VALLASLALVACTDQAEQAPDDAATADTSETTVRVQMNDFAFAPDTLRLPAGRPVRLVFENTGAVPHEFMAGRAITSEADGFQDGLFANVEMHMDREAMEAHGETGKEAGGHEMNTPDPTGHKTMLLLEPGATSTMTFTLPASRGGTWIMACFQPGHFQAGMQGTIIVE
jgi:uncharacterized cupredoxin-like copper-binding protein